jgi:hypothetical protein
MRGKKQNTSNKKPPAVYVNDKRLWIEARRQTAI